MDLIIIKLIIFVYELYYCRNKWIKDNVLYKFIYNV